MAELSPAELRELAEWLRGIVGNPMYQRLQGYIQQQIDSKIRECYRSPNITDWQRGRVCGYEDCARIPFDLIETCGTVQDTK